MEDHEVFRASTVYFDASHQNKARRPASLGPGIAFPSDDHLQSDDFDEQHDINGTDEEALRGFRALTQLEGIIPG